MITSAEARRITDRARDQSGRTLTDLCVSKIIAAAGGRDYTVVFDVPNRFNMEEIDNAVKELKEEPNYFVARRYKNNLGTMCIEIVW